jgi:hypothetical protein
VKINAPRQLAAREPRRRLLERPTTGDGRFAPLAHDRPSSAPQRFHRQTTLLPPQQLGKANKKPRRSPEVTRRGRNREEAKSLLWGIKKIRQSPTARYEYVRLGLAEQTLAASWFTHDDTPFKPCVKLFNNILLGIFARPILALSAAIPVLPARQCLTPLKFPQMTCLPRIAR